jgi:replicative DNA helicase
MDSDRDDIIELLRVEARSFGLKPSDFKTFIDGIWNAYIEAFESQRKEDREGFKLIQRKAVLKKREKLFERVKKILVEDLAAYEPDSIIAEFSECISDMSEFIREYGNIDKTKKVQSLLERNNEEWKLADSREAGVKLGYELDRFDELADKLDGIQPGLYITAADTNIGKTAFLANLFLDALQANPNLNGLYITLDDSVSSIINRFLTIFTRFNLEKIPKKNDKDSKHNRRLALCQINRLKIKIDRNKKPLFFDARETARRELDRLAATGRMDIKELSDFDFKNIMGAIEGYIRSKTARNKEFFIAIDALYNLPVGSDSNDPRMQNITRADQLQDLSKEFDIPILTTAELRKPPNLRFKPRDSKNIPTLNDIMESGKYAYNADAVFMLYPENFEKFKSESEPVLIADVQKNKLSDFTGQLHYKFVKYSAFLESTERIADKSESARKSRKGKKNAGGGKSGNRKLFVAGSNNKLRPVTQLDMIGWDDDEDV